MVVGLKIEIGGQIVAYIFSAFLPLSYLLPSLLEQEQFDFEVRHRSGRKVRLEVTFCYVMVSEMRQ